MTLLRRTFCTWLGAASAAALCALGAPAHAAGASAANPAWPTRSISVIVPFGAGSSPDVMSRIVIEHAAQSLGQSMVVLNRPGASGNIGTHAIAKAAPDGYTIGVSITGPLVNNPLMDANLPYRPERDLQPITLAVHQYNLLVVPADSPLKHLDDLLAAARAPQSRLNFPSTGAGTVSHLAVELLMARAQGQALHVPYPSSPAAVTSLLNGDTQFAALPPVAVMPMIQGGKLRALAAVSAQRMAALPDVPTVAELGYPGIEGSGWIGFVAPAGLNAQVLARLNAALTQALQDEAVRQRLAGMHMQPAPGTPEDFARYLQQESQRWAPVIERLGLAAQPTTAAPLNAPLNAPKNTPEATPPTTDPTATSKTP